MVRTEERLAVKKRAVGMFLPSLEWGWAQVFIVQNQVSLNCGLWATPILWIVLHSQQVKDSFIFLMSCKNKKEYSTGTMYGFKIFTKWTFTEKNLTIPYQYSLNYIKCPCICGLVQGPKYVDVQVSYIKWHSICVQLTYIILCSSNNL